MTSKAYPPVTLQGQKSIWSANNFFFCALIAAFSLCLIHAAAYLLVGLKSPVIDFHPFRQTQTALSAYWLALGGPWIAYETPIFGYPWAAPLEFPFYQWLVALLYQGGISIDAGARIVSFSFFLACLVPLWILLRALHFSTTSFLIIGVLFLSSPLYLLWSRTVLIETCALFFSVLWIASFARFSQGGGVGWFVITLIAGILATLIKATTFPAFALLGGFLAAATLWRWRGDPLAKHIQWIAAVAFAFVIPLAAGVMWVAFSDAIKEQNSIAALWKSENLFVWNFGTWGQRISLSFWRDAIVDRVIPDIFGYSFLMAGYVLLGEGIFSGRYRAAILASSLAFLAPLLIFTNLHFIHRYYQVANAIFLLGAVGLSIASMYESGRRWAAMIALTAIVGGQSYFYHRNLRPIIAADYSQDPLLRLALLARDKTRPNDSLIVLGVVTPTVAYYSERKSLTLPYDVPTPLMEEIFNNPQKFLGERALGAIVYCGALSKRFKEGSTLVAGFASNRDVLGEVGDCKLLSPNQFDTRSR